MITGVPASRDAENVTVTVARIDVQSIQLSASSSGNVFLDVDCGHFDGFTGTSIGYPIVFSGADQAQFFAFAVGAGGTWRVSPHGNWKFDLIATLMPTWWGGSTVAFEIPLIGAAPGCNEELGDYEGNSSIGGCRQVGGGASLVGNYHLQAGVSLSLVTLGYRF